MRFLETEIEQIRKLKHHEKTQHTFLESEKCATFSD